MRVCRQESRRLQALDFAIGLETQGPLNGRPRRTDRSRGSFAMIAGMVLQELSAPSLEMIAALRRHCWKNVLPDLGLLADGHDEHALHFLVFDERSLIAAARLCVHEFLAQVPDPYLFVGEYFPFAPRFGCMNRLVVHPDYRGIGISAMLDRARIETAKSLGCRSMLVVSSLHSGVRRRQALDAQGFTCVTRGEGVDDGMWGISYPFARRIDTYPGADDCTCPVAADRAGLSIRFNGLLTAQHAAQAGS